MSKQQFIQQRESELVNSQSIYPSKALWQIEREYLELNEELINNEGELTEEINNRLIINKNELDTKSSSYVYVIKNNVSDCDAIDKEIERLTALKKSRSSATEKLRAALLNAMNLYGVKKIETPLLKISAVEAEAIEIEDETLIPAEYKNTKLVTTVSKTAIKGAIKAGKVVMGASIIKNSHLRIS